MSVHSSPLRLAAFWFAWSSFLPARRSRAVIIDAVVVLTQHRQIRRLGMPTVFVGVDVVDLAPVGRDVAVRPGADEILGHSQGSQLVGCEAGFIKIDRASGGMEQTDVKLFA